jgi:dCMP deaminase
LRESKINYYINIARNVSLRSPCSRRKFGSIIVKNDSIISTGFNGSARGTLNCGEDVPCLKDKTGELSLVSYDTCPAVHAEQNAIVYADPDRRIGGTMYLASSTTSDGDRPCHLCRRYILQSGINDIYYLDKNGKLQHEIISNWVDMENKWMLDILEKTKGIRMKVPKD